MARKTLGRKLRFEVFKRDGFKCQYCGGSAPDVVLHVDHIRPVAGGGDDDLTNLITACQPCNSGKGARELSDRSVAEKQRSQLDALHERREQLDMMLEWKTGLVGLDHEEAVKVGQFWCSLVGWSCLSEYGLGEVRNLIRDFGASETLDSMRVAADAYPDPLVGFTKLGGICHNTRRDATLTGDEKALFRCRAILRKQLGYVNESRVMELLGGAMADGYSAQQLLSLSAQAHNWTGFQRDIGAMIARPHDA